MRDQPLPRTLRTRAAILFGLGGVLGLAAIAMALAGRALPPSSQSPVAAEVVAESTGAPLPRTAVAGGPLARPADASRGKALFINKGCSTCHVYAAIETERSYSVGPELTQHAPRLDPDYLRRWLADPEAIRPGTAMPDLDLSPEEIGALVAFLRG